MQNMPPVAPGADSDAIYDAFREVGYSPHSTPRYRNRLLTETATVCPRSPGPPQHPHRQGWPLQHRPHHRPAHRRCPSPDREHRRCQSSPPLILLA
jgi:hypothetical protein